jgi:Family of unknown function (DUF6065)
VHAVDLLSDLGRTAPIVAAPVKRDWMGRTPAGFAYRRLPLDTANAHGWLIPRSAASRTQRLNDARSTNGATAPRTVIARGGTRSVCHSMNAVRTRAVTGLLHSARRVPATSAVPRLEYPDAARHKR